MFWRKNKSRCNLVQNSSKLEKTEIKKTICQNFKYIIMIKINSNVKIFAVIPLKNFNFPPEMYKNFDSSKIA